MDVDDKGRNYVVSGTQQASNPTRRVLADVYVVEGGTWNKTYSLEPPR